MRASIGKILMIISITAMLVPAYASAQKKTFTVTLDNCINGSLKIDPAVPADGKFPEETVLTVSAVSDAGDALDSVYFSIPGMFGQMYHESMASPFKVIVDQDKHIGASFIEQASVAHLDVIQDIVYAKPGVKTLKYDVYKPKGAKNLPIIVIIHGGGWSANTEDIMRGMARELTRNGKYVVCSIDYRWIQKNDGDAVGNTIEQLRSEMMSAIRAAAPSYGVFGGDLLKRFSDDPAGDSSWADAIAPISHIPNVKDRAVPQYLLRGSNDFLITDETVRSYADALAKAGQRVEYVQVNGANHAFFDWKPDEQTKAFAKYANITDGSNGAYKAPESWTNVVKTKP